MALYQTGTPQQNQVQDRITANNTLLASGQTLTPQVAQQASTDYGNVNQEMQSTQTPGARQGYLDQTNLGAAQGNYDALAKQLASYDQMVLQPQFQGSNPGAPSELNGLSGYVNPNLSYNSADTRTPDQSMYNANPTYGLNTQADQGNSIVNLLSTLSRTIANESARGTNKYTSDLKSLASMLGPLNDILTQNTNLTMKKAELADAKQARAASLAKSSSDKADSEYYAAIDDGINSLKSGEDWGTIWGRISARFPDKYRSIDNDLGTSWREPGAYEKYLSKGLDVKQTYKTNSANDDQDFKDVGSGLESYLTRRKDTSMLDRVNPTSTKGIAVETERSTLSRILAKLVEKNRISDSDAKFYINQLPPVWMDEKQAQAKIDGIKNGLAAKMGLSIDSSTGATTGGGSANDPLGIR